ncbi:MAG TPA: hypothetical protein VEJ41_01320 [Candidatus Acidoferrales bacterium]|nr:hypothetical protein [Candidatus Acidoferrales bacterium]
MKTPELLADYARSFGGFVVQLPQAVSFPCLVTLGLRENSSARPQGIEADFLSFVATGREHAPEGEWPQAPIAAQTLLYDGTRLAVKTIDGEYRMIVDRKCPVALTSTTATPDDFARIADPELLGAYIAERPHTQTALLLEMHVPQMRIETPKPSKSLISGQQRPLYERPSTAKSLVWLVVGAVLIVVGARWLGLGMKQGIVVNFYGWGIMVLGAVLVVRRGLDLLFPPSRL